MFFIEYFSPRYFIVLYGVGERRGCQALCHREKLRHVLGRVGATLACHGSARSCAPDHESEAKASSTVVARREARIPKVFPTVLFTLDEGRPPRFYVAPRREGG
jgi:hypothetical protein